MNDDVCNDSARKIHLGRFKNWVDDQVASVPPTGYITNDLNFLYNEFKNETAEERRDGKLVATLDQKLSTATYQKCWDYPGQFAYGSHTLKLVFKVTSSTIYRGSLDAVIVR